MRKVIVSMNVTLDGPHNAPGFFSILLSYKWYRYKSRDGN
jgi:hypothetical protein